MIQNVIPKRLGLYAHKIQPKHEIKPDYRLKGYDFASLMLNKISPDTDSHWEVKLAGLEKSEARPCEEVISFGQ
jgi:hypothetical protein